MSQRVLIVGLDCLGPELLEPQSLAHLPALASLVERGLSGPLRSTVPPITVPAWTSMLSGRDPGELGLYGFRNRRSHRYGDMRHADSTLVRHPRLWDHVGAAGGRSIVVGVPQTHPAPPIDGVLVAGFEPGGMLDDRSGLTQPQELAARLREVAPEYRFDVDEFRNIAREHVLAQVHSMTDARFRAAEWLMESEPWQLAIVCEIAPDRLHHCFWSDHDPRHPRHDPRSPFGAAVRQYYRRLDALVGRLVERAGEGTTVIVASDHGAQPMEGGVCVNELLREAGWLVLHEEPREAVPLVPELVDWSRTRAWAEGGYYARVFLNVAGREPQGIVPRADVEAARADLEALLATLDLGDGRTLVNEVVRPERAYRRVRAIPPDLLVLFGGLRWRSLGSVGHGRRWLVGNDTGVDEANHAPDGLYVVVPPGGAEPEHRRASILDIAPTALAALGLAAPPDLQGEPLRAPVAA